MLVSTIINNGYLLSDVANTSFYTPAEALFAAQLAWDQVYSFLATNNDDYFVTPLYFKPASNAAVSYDANRGFTWLMDTTNNVIFADGFYRLRLIQYQGYGGTVAYYPVQKMTIENFGNTQNSPAYRFEGKYLAVYDPSNYDSYCLWYYPRPETITTSTDLAYPYSMVPEFMAYQVAIEIRRKQKADVAAWQTRANELMAVMAQQSSRDDSHGEPIKNMFGQGFSPYI